MQTEEASVLDGEMSTHVEDVDESNERVNRFNRTVERRLKRQVLEMWNVEYRIWNLW